MAGRGIQQLIHIRYRGFGCQSGSSHPSEGYPLWFEMHSLTAGQQEAFCSRVINSLGAALSVHDAAHMQSSAWQFVDCKVVKCLSAAVLGSGVIFTESPEKEIVSRVRARNTHTHMSMLSSCSADSTTYSRLHPHAPAILQ